MADNRFTMENGEIDHVRKSGVEYAARRAKGFQQECFSRFHMLLGSRLKPKALLRECKRVFEDFSGLLEPEIATAHIIGELSMCERIYFEVLKTPEEEINKNEMLAMLQVVMVHIQNETIEKCELPDKLKISLEQILERDGFYKDKPAKDVGYEVMPKVGE